MAAGQDINVKINGDISLLTKSLTRAKNQIALFQTSVRPMGDSLKRMEPQFKKVATISDAVADSLTRQGKGKGNWTFMGDAIDRTTSSLTRAKQPLMSMTDAINRSKQTRRGWISDVQTMGTRAAPTATRGLQGLDGVISRTTKKMKKAKREFAGWALSIMFFGMALKGAFDVIWKQSTKTFQDVMHSTKGVTTEFDMLTGSLDYLKFTAGAALEPIAKFLYPIIDTVTDWISANESLFRGFVIALGVGGTVLTAIGMGKLALDGMATAFELLFNKNIADTSLIKGLKGMSIDKKFAIGASIYLVEDTIKDLKNGDLMGAAGNAVFEAGILAASFGGNKKLGGALVAIGAAIELTNAVLKGGGELTRETLASWLIKTGGMAAFANIGVGAALITVGVGLSLVSNDFFQEVTGKLGIMVGVIGAVITGVLETILSPAIFAINSVISAANLITGSNIKPVDQFHISKGIIERVQEMRRDLNDIDYESDLPAFGTYAAQEKQKQIDNPQTSTMYPSNEQIKWQLFIDGEELFNVYSKLLTSSMY